MSELRDTVDLRHGSIHPDALGAVLLACRTAGGAEPCGLLLGHVAESDVRIEEAVATPNAHPTPDRAFQIPAAAHADAVRRARAKGWKVVGTWHGHLAGPPEPGATDAAGLREQEAVDGEARVLLIAGSGGGAAPVVRGYASRQGDRLQEIPLRA